MSKPDNRWLGDLGLASVLGIVLLALSLLPIWGHTGSALFGGKIIDAILGQSIWDTTLGWNLALFVLTLVAVHVGFSWACLVVAWLSSLAWPNAQTPRRTWLFLWFCIGTGWVLIANSASFPGSSLGATYAEGVTKSWHGVTIYRAATATLLAGLLATIVRVLPHLAFRAPAKWIAATAGTAALGFFGIAQLSSAAASRAPYDKPHVIIIGLDSLRFDAKARAEITTPHLNMYLRDATVFTDATTPLARTFPSWVSIISGRMPATSGALMNLLPRDLIRPGDTLPMMFRRAGYRTVYAIDEVRFSNLDETYGFDEMIAPPIGASDFMIGFFADTPLSNLLVNSRPGEWLFPYVHANRAANVTYDPDTFVRRVDRSLDVGGPTFLALHMTLAHWPYTWANTPLRVKDKDQTSWPLYGPALSRVDHQFAEVMDTLKRHGLLDNAIVVVLSDHGESLGTCEDVPPPPDEELARDFNPLTNTGHGTSVFDAHQYRVLLSIRFFGKATNMSSVGGRIDVPVSLIDVAPTLADLLSLKPETQFDGLSLKQFLNADPTVNSSTFSERIRFTETEFNPPGIAAGQTMTTDSLRSASSFYQVDPVTDRISVRREDLREILLRRDYAAFRGNKLLAAVHNRERPGDWAYVFVDEQRKPIRWTPDQAMADIDQAQLWEALRNQLERSQNPGTQWR